MKGFKGTPNTSGRPKGSPNKITTVIREKFNLLIESNISALQNDLDKLEPKDRVDAIIRLLPYILSKQIELSSEQTIPSFQPLIINVTEQPLKLSD